MNREIVRWGNGPRSPGWYVDEDGCHVWVGARCGGYGVVGADGRMWSVHRLRYLREVGPIPDGMELDHLCNKGPLGCCNPLHCEPVTHAENNRRSAARITHCPQGHEYTPENLSAWHLAIGQRRCRACVNEGQRRARKERAESRPPRICVDCDKPTKRHNSPRCVEHVREARRRGWREYHRRKAARV